MSSDGDGKPLPEADIFQVMIYMARNLALDGELDPSREALCWALWNTQLDVMGLPAQDLEEMRRTFGTGGPRDG